MSPTEVFVAASSFLLAVLTVGCVLTAVPARRTPAPATPRQYLAGRLDGVRISAAVVAGDELLITLVLDPDVTLSAEAFRIAPGRHALPRVTRWRDQTSSLRCYLSGDESIMLVDPVLGDVVAADPVRALSDDIPSGSVWPGGTRPGHSEHS